MAAPVWVLSVDLQTKTATFQSGMADAAKSARGAFTDIKSGSTEMSSHIGGNMFASRHAIMAVSEAFGVQVPRAITALIAHVGPLGAALEAAFPFAAIALGAVLLIEHLAALREAGIKLTEDQIKFGTAVQDAFNSLDQRLLQAQIKADELRNDHLGALHKQLELIDMQSMDQLVQTFGKVAKAADTVFADLKSHWYTFGIGAAGAKHALEDFQTHYDSLLAQGKDKEASDLLSGTLASANKVLEAQKQIAAHPTHTAMSADDGSEAQTQTAVNKLKAAGVGHTENEVKAQQTLVDALNAQVSVEGKIAAITSQDKNNAKTTTGKELAGLAAEGAREAANHRQKMAELSLAMEREQANATLDIWRATVSQRLAVDTEFADAERDIQLRGNKDLQAALDKGGKDYNNQLAALQDKAAEIQAQHRNAVAALESKAREELNRRAIQDLEQSEKEKIDAAGKGTQQRLAALDEAIKTEQSKNLQDTQHYRELLIERVETLRQFTEEQAKLTAEAGKEEASNVQKMGELALAAEREQTALRNSSRRVLLAELLAQEIQAANEDHEVKMAALRADEAALDKGGNDYANKLKAIQNKEQQMVREHENEVTAIKDKAEKERNAKILAAAAHFNDAIAGGLTEVLMGHKSFASMMNSLGNQVVSGMMQNAIQSILANDMTKESDAAAAARKAFLSGMQLPFPVNVVAAPVFGAAAFASVMAFQSGTDMVPGAGRGDTVPAMLEPGEGVVPGGVMDGLRNMARSGTMGGEKHFHAPITYSPVIQAVDAQGVDRMLDKHAKSFQRHVETTLRKLNN